MSERLPPPSPPEMFRFTFRYEGTGASTTREEIYDGVIRSHVNSRYYFLTFASGITVGVPLLDRYVKIEPMSSS